MQVAFDSIEGRGKSPGCGGQYYRGVKKKTYLSLSLSTPMMALNDLDRGLLGYKRRRWL